MLKNKHFLNEKGQAFAEYMPLMPPILALSFALLIPLGRATADAFCKASTPFAVQVCQAAEGNEDGEDGSPAVDEEEAACIVLQEELGGSQCDQSNQCSTLPGLNDAVFFAADPIKSLVIKAGKGYHIFDSGLTDDGCYQVVFGPENRVEWTKVGSGSSCKDVSHAQAWKTLVCR